MRVGVAGGGPGAEAVFAALSDAGAGSETDADATTIDPGAVGQVDLAVVVALAGDEAFDRANEASLAAETPWLAVELGGVGGFDVGVEAAVSGFAPGTACYECLRGRVAANADGTTGADDGIANTDDATARFAGALAGRETVRLLADDESPALEGVVEVPHARRYVLPLPHCDCAGHGAGGGDGNSGRDWSLRRGYEARDLDAALERAERALDPRVGIVHEVGEAESFPVPYYLATLCDTAGFSDATASRHAAGVDSDWNPAFVKALGEALERYGAGVYREADLVHGTVADVEHAVPPSTFVTASGFDSSDSASDPEIDLAWVSGEHLGTGETVHLPAEFVLFPPPEVRHRPSITTGLGLGNSGTEALLSGLYEVIERDAAMLAWYSTFEPLGLAVEDEAFETLARRARAEDLDVTALLLTQDADVPVVTACVHREEGAVGTTETAGTAMADGDGWPHFAAGMAADLDPVVAVRSALAEALQNWMELRGMGREDALGEGAIGRYADFPDDVRAFVSPGTEVPAASVGPDEVPEGEAELDAVVERVADVGLDAYGVRLTPRDVEALGFEAVRVVVPAAQPLFSGEPYFGERAETVPRELGFEPRLDREHHPFP